MKLFCYMVYPNLTSVLSVGLPAVEQELKMFFKARQISQIVFNEQLSPTLDKCTPTPALGCGTKSKTRNLCAAPTRTDNHARSSRPR